MKVQFSYLDSKFKGFMDQDHEIYQNLRSLMDSGDFTLGKAVEEFETNVAKLIGAKYALGVANGTDALRIGLRLVGVRPGDEVITAANTFVASAGCIDELFATPRFVDMAPNYVMDVGLVERAITSKTKAIVPVHFTGEPVEMDHLMHVARKHNIPVVEDACQALMAEYKGECCGTIGDFGAISLHPLKVLNGTGDGGVLVTNNKDLYDKAKLYRNHGLVGRNEIKSFGCNSRLDTIQAVFLNHLIKETPSAMSARRFNADFYDQYLREIPGISIIERRPYAKSCFHLYFMEVAENHRDSLVAFLNKHEIEARVHYPIPLQGVLEVCGYSRADFPLAYRQSDRIITLPVHEHLTMQQLQFVIDKIRNYMSVGKRSW